MRIEVAHDPYELAALAAQKWIETAAKSIQERGRFMVALSGGNTPKELFRLLASRGMREQVDWRAVHFFWADERFVPRDHPESNFNMAREFLLDPLGIPKNQIHAVPTERGTPVQVSRFYEQELQTIFLKFNAMTQDGFPRFDLILLGLGEDGHTASLFPDGKIANPVTAVGKRDSLVWAAWVPHLKANRITLSLPVLNSASTTLFLVSGQSKAAVVAQVLEGEPNPERYPAQRIQPNHGQLFWLLDFPAASHLALQSYHQAAG